MWLLLATGAVTAAEDYVSYDDAYNTTTATSNDRKGFKDVQTYCRNTYVRVTDLSLLCDSPGAYYYGSTTYRNSEVCVTGDKAKLYMEGRLGRIHG